MSQRAAVVAAPAFEVAAGQQRAGVLVAGGDGHGVIDALDAEGRAAGGVVRDPRLAVAVLAPAAHLARAQQRTGEMGAGADGDRVGDAIAGRRRGVGLGAVDRLRPALHVAVAQQRAFVEGAGADGDGVADAVDEHGAAPGSAVVGLAELALRLAEVAPACDAAVGQRGARVRVAARDRHDVRQAGHRHGRRAGLDAAIAELPQVAVAPAAHVAAVGEHAMARQRHGLAGADDGARPAVGLVPARDAAVATQAAVAGHGGDVVQRQRRDGRVRGIGRPGVAAPAGHVALRGGGAGVVGARAHRDGAQPRGGVRRTGRAAAGSERDRRIETCDLHGALVVPVLVDPVAVVRRSGDRLGARRDDPTAGGSALALHLPAGGRRGERGLLLMAVDEQPRLGAKAHLDLQRVILVVARDAVEPALRLGRARVAGDAHQQAQAEAQAPGERRPEGRHGRRRARREGRRRAHRLTSTR